MKASLGALAVISVLVVGASCGGKQLALIEAGPGGDDAREPDGRGRESASEDVGSGDDDGSGDDNGSGDVFASEDVGTGDDVGSGDDGPTTEAGGTCMETSSTGSAGPGGCSTEVGEKCSGPGGAVYTAECSCPAATCSCTSMMGSTGMGSVGTPYSGCASSCSNDNEAFKSCGFPIPTP